jgi:hypothetical protein
MSTMQYHSSGSVRGSEKLRAMSLIKGYDAETLHHQIWEEMGADLVIPV